MKGRDPARGRRIYLSWILLFISVPLVFVPAFIPNVLLSLSVFVAAIILFCGLYVHLIRTILRSLTA